MNSYPEISIVVPCCNYGRFLPACLDSPCFLAETVPVLKKNPHVGMVYGDVALMNERGTITQERSDDVHGDRDACGNEFIALLKKDYIRCGCSAPRSYRDAGTTMANGSGNALPPEIYLR